MRATNKVGSDSDTASDDAVVLMMAFAHCEVNIVWLEIMAGNCALEPAIQNVLLSG